MLVSGQVTTAWVKQTATNWCPGAAAQEDAPLGRIPRKGWYSRPAPTSQLARASALEGKAAASRPWLAGWTREHNCRARAAAVGGPCRTTAVAIAPPASTVTAPMPSRLRRRRVSTATPGTQLGPRPCLVDAGVAPWVACSSWSRLGGILSALRHRASRTCSSPSSCQVVGPTPPDLGRAPLHDQEPVRDRHQGHVMVPARPATPHWRNRAAMLSV